MTREEAQELLPVIQAFAEGKKVEVKTLGSDWEELADDEDANFDSEIEWYRTAPEPKYRPFRTKEECWQEMQKHQQFGWLKDEDDSHYTAITFVDDDDEGGDANNISISGNNGWSFEGVMGCFTFADGAPFGIKEEE